MSKHHDDSEDNDMIVGNEAVSVSTGADATRQHFENGEHNEIAECILGEPAALGSMEADADRFGHEIFAQCFLANPEKDRTRMQFLTIILPTIARYNKLPIAEAVVYEHQRALKGGVSHRHWHIAWAHADPATGKVRDWGWSYVTNELCGRTLEVMLGETIQCGRFQELVIAQMRANGDHEMADKVAAAHPPGAKPKGRSAKRKIEQAARARGIDLRDINKIVGPAYSAATNLDELRAGLAERGLSLEISHRIPDRLAWVIHKDGRFVCSLCGSLPRVSLASIIAKIGEPNGPERSEIERSAPAGNTGRNPDHVEEPAGQGRGADRTPDRPKPQDDDAAAEIFIAALNAADPAPFESCLVRAMLLAQGALARALAYLSDAEAQARSYLGRAMADIPPPSKYL